MDYLVKLYDLPNVQPLLEKLQNEGVSIRRAISLEKRIVVSWVKSTFGHGWVPECEMTFSEHPISCFVALHNKKLVGFCCFDATYKGFLGPAGVAAVYRNRGIGRTLMLRSLQSMADQGYAYAILGAALPNYYEKNLRAIPIPGSTPGPYQNVLTR